MVHLLRSLVVVVLSFCLGETASAHPGHGASGAGPVHYLSEPIHAVWLLVPVVLAALAVLTVAWRSRRAAANS